ncbi:glycoside hydrolase family 32 protein [Vibrio mediterranei]|uniref:glycoside hydrolase family 32 protein n=1 Tax=Vibrio mediterranei TaxID=689 RepID=UPI0040694D02
MTSLELCSQSELSVPNQCHTDHLRPRFHLTAPYGLINDPNGFIEHDGQYHLFFQWNPHACEHGAKYWGHSTSQDLINWTLQPDALKPNDSYDQHGCYSGSAFVLDDQLHLFYTGNVKTSDGTRLSTQCLAKATDESNQQFTKLGPVIEKHPEGYTAHFRDPKIWSHDGLWYCVIGAQTTEELGQVLLYRSEDAHNWQFLGPIAGNKINDVSGFGYMFECPDLFHLGNSDVLIGCPQGIEPDGFHFENKHNNGYFVGKLDYPSATYSHGSFKPLDQGFEFYAPQTTGASDGRRLLSAWIGIPDEDEQPTTDNNWIHALSLVRELTVRNGKMYQLPAREHARLRGQESGFEDIQLSSESHISIESKHCFELQLDVEQIAGEFTLKLADEGDSWIALQYDPQTSIMTLDRTQSSYLPGMRKCQLSSGDKFTVQVFFDQSIIEVFVNQGEEVFTSRVFPNSNQSKITLETGKSCIIRSFVKYDY